MRRSTVHRATGRAGSAALSSLQVFLDPKVAFWALDARKALIRLSTTASDTAVREGGRLRAA